MNKAMIASMREQLRPSEAARAALLERVGEIPNKREGNSVRKYFAVAACAALLLCAYPAYNVLKSQNPPKLHSYITVEAGDIGAIKAYRQESSDVGGGEGPGEGPNLGVLNDPVEEETVQLGAAAYQLLMDHFGDSRPDWYGGAYLDDSGTLMVLLVEDRNPGDKSLELEVMKAVGDLPVCFASAKYSRNELERINGELLHILDGTGVFSSFGIYDDQNRIILDVPEPLTEELLAAIGELDPEDDAILIRVVEGVAMTTDWVKGPAPIEPIGGAVLPGGVTTAEPVKAEEPVGYTAGPAASAVPDEDLIAIEPQDKGTQVEELPGEKTVPASYDLLPLEE